MTGGDAAPRGTLRALLLAGTVAGCGLLGHQPPPPPDPAGWWEGTLVANGVRLPLTLELRREPAGGWHGTLDMPTQYVLDDSVAHLQVDSLGFRCELPDALPPGRLEGAVLDRGRMRGTYTATFAPDTLRGTFELWRRPEPSRPYRTEEVRFPGGAYELAGSVYTPLSPGPHPAIVFVHGSGPQSRESYIRWFADAFARRGFVTLIYDKRGTGASGGPRWPDTPGGFADLAEDAARAVAIVGRRPDVDSMRLGIWGLSQGAWIAPLAGARGARIAFAMLLSGGGVTPAEQELYDDEINLRDLGFAPDQVAAAIRYLRLADDYVRSQADADWQRFAAARDTARTRPWYRHLDRFPQILPREAPLWQDLRTDLDYDPTPALRALRGPTLLILGEEDRSTPARRTAERVRAVFPAAGNPRLTMRLVPGADHALQVPHDAVPWLAARPYPGWVAAMLDWADNIVAR